MNKRLALVSGGILVLALLVWAVLHFRSGSSAVFRNIPSVYDVDPTEVADQLPPIHGEVAVYRLRDANGNWTEALREAPKDARDAQIMGVLHDEPVPGAVEVPIYVCRYAFEVKGETRESLSFATSADCSGSHRLESPMPVGYLSKQPRLGYMLFMRCFDPKHGFYMSLNSRCEDETHAYSEPLGYIRAAAFVHPQQ